MMLQADHIRKFGLFEENVLYSLRAVRKNESESRSP